MILAALLLAQAAPDKLDAANPTVFMGLLIAAVGAIALVADRIDSMVQRRKRSPSLDVDLVGLQASITTLNASVAELKAAKDHHNGHRERIAALETRCHDLTEQLAREVAAQRSFSAKNTREIFERIETDNKEMRLAIGALTTTINKEFNTLYRALGKMEGVTLDERE